MHQEGTPTPFPFQKISVLLTTEYSEANKGATVLLRERQNSGREEKYNMKLSHLDCEQCTRLRSVQTKVQTKEGIVDQIRVWTKLHSKVESKIMIRELTNVDQNTYQGYWWIWWSGGRDGPGTHALVAPAGDGTCEVQSVWGSQTLLS